MPGGRGATISCRRTRLSISATLVVATKDGNEYESNVLKYEYKTDVSNSETHSDIYLIRKTTFTNLFIDNLQLQNHVKAKVLIHKREYHIHPYLFK
jgi:hypothetical protein